MEGVGTAGGREATVGCGWAPGLGVGGMEEDRRTREVSVEVPARRGRLLG